MDASDGQKGKKCGPKARGGRNVVEDEDEEDNMNRQTDE